MKPPKDLFEKLMNASEARVPHHVARPITWTVEHNDGMVTIRSSAGHCTLMSEKAYAAMVKYAEEHKEP